jgi:hypothetical protein
MATGFCQTQLAFEHREKYDLITQAILRAGLTPLPSKSNVWDPRAVRQHNWMFNPEKHTSFIEELEGMMQETIDESDGEAPASFWQERGAGGDIVVFKHNGDNQEIADSLL